VLRRLADLGLFLTGLLFTGGLAAGCQAEVAGGSADGAAIFAQACARCHGDTGRPNEQMMKGLGVRDLTSAEFAARASLPLVQKQVRDGSENKIMPGFASTLTAPQIDAVAAYVLTLAPKR
jgi:mono/diheme cytochrome c family protein